MKWESFQFFTPPKFFVWAFALVALAWFLFPLVRAFKFKSVNGYSVASLIFRAATVILLWAALYQMSQSLEFEFKSTDHVAGLIIDGSESFDGEAHRRRIKWLQEHGRWKACLFGDHAEIFSENQSLAENIGTHRTSKVHTLKECLERLQAAGLKPENIVALTDGRLLWDVPLVDAPIYWVHLDQGQSGADLAVDAPLNKQLLFYGTDNRLTVDVLTRGISGSAPLGVYGPQGLIRTIDVPSSDTWTTVTISLSTVDAGQLESGTPLVLRFPKLSNEHNHDNNEAIVFPIWAPHKIKILHVSGSPSTDTYYLRRWLKAQVNFDVISFYILKDFDDDSTVPQNEISLIPFPVEKLFGSELEKFNVVILQNFEWGSFLRGQLIRTLKGFLQTPGKGLFLLGGPRAFKGRDLIMEDLQSLLPFHMESGQLGRPSSYVDFPNHGEWVWANDLPLKPLFSIPIHIEKYPTVDAINDLLMKENATPWAGVNLPSGKTRWLVASHEWGDGRVLMTLTDQLFRWFLEASDLNLGDLYGQFFEKSLSWLSFNSVGMMATPMWPPMAYKNEGFQIAHKGTVFVQCGDKKYEVDPPSWVSPDFGFCRVTKPRPQWIYRHHVNQEKTIRPLELSELEAKVTRMGGRFFSKPSESDWTELLKLASGFKGSPARQTHEIWNTTYMLTILIFLFVGDWYCRRKSGLR